MPRADSTYQLTSPERATIRQAMLSVFYHSLGRQWQQNGAPAVVLPPEARILGLAEALEQLTPWPSRRRDAIWRVVRSVPVARVGAALERYPKELRDVVDHDWLSDLDDRRRHYRTGATLFAAALEAAAGNRPDQMSEILTIMGKQIAGKGGGDSFNTAIDTTMNLSAEAFIEALDVGSGPQSLVEQLPRLEEKIGRNAHDIVLDIADTAAFHDSVSASAANQQADASAVPVTVYPVCSTVEQDTGDLTTTTTVTTIVHAPFAVLRQWVDPRAWQLSSDVIQSAKYVKSVYSEDPPDDVPAAGSGDGRPLLVREKAALTWGPDDNQRAEFDLVLRTNLDVREGDEDRRASINFEFDLALSIDSRILWDERAGGVLVDKGFVMVRPMLPDKDRWRVITRKVLKFSDRTPNLDGTGWSDAGQMVNYLSPAAMTWWTESETYSMESPSYEPEEQAGDR